MDNNQQVPQQQMPAPAPAPTPPQPSPSEKKPMSKTVIIVIILLVLICLTAVGAIAYNLFLNSNQTESDKNKTSMENTLETPTPSPFDEEGTPSPTASPSAAQSQIKAALTSKNYAALESYMNESVSFILYASECCGEITATEVAAQLSYLDSATAPWDFDQANSIITKIKTQYASEYGSLFIGIASNEYLAAFGLGENGKINIIKLAVTYKLLVNE